MPAYQPLPYWYDAAELLETYTTYEAFLLFDVSKYVADASMFFEAILRSADGGEVKARLFNITDDAAVPGSTVTTTATVDTRLRSGALTLTGAKEYRAEVRRSPSTTTILVARLIVQQ